ncbi:MAG: ParB/RepB/Spo0J family partition protein [Gammaproteobacteria bacterium]|nr:ParB/RepB/Spo0J family partition protein [Gammaproteobacteria bacterium]
MAKKPAMGRNLNSLLGGRTKPKPSARPTERQTQQDTAGDVVEGVAVEAEEAAPKTEVPASVQGLATGDKFRLLGVDQITRGSYQPRQHFDPVLLQELADSIKAQGLIQPVLVRPFGGKYELIAGERRWRAAQLAGIGDIPAIVRELDDESVAAVSLIENIQRKDLNPLEEAAALSRLCDEFGMTHDALAESIGRSRAAVSNTLRLLDLHDEPKRLLEAGQLDMGHARALLGAPLEDQPELAKRIVNQQLTVRAVEKLIREMRTGKRNGTKSASTSNDPDIRKLEQSLGEKLGAGVSIKHKQSGAGKLEITYGSIDELEGILSHIK